MAKVTVVNAVPAVVPPPTYLLELSEEEAKLLRAILGLGVNGKSTGRRRLSEAIWQALYDAKVPEPPVNTPMDFEGEIRFTR